MIIQIVLIISIYKNYLFIEILLVNKVLQRYC